ncbi:MAG: stage II sporulation protein P, partial [Lachnospiraceae bacterium]|nr:stage II sporulation protein P [Lachnospiraceae bacterium]
PNLTIKNYLKGYRYNMHLCKRFLLIELGNQNNTMKEAKNTMSYLAEILNDVLTNK